ncbi:hypothetical protein ACFPU1_12415 [Thalassorhabdus alkalitolerans]|uniref:Uncharacterized protein n=1 Tax=Thalassorhabdus alkalitolerans TaxID=2282697 RepID=A0ABW0YR52_9BACI|nr:MULTISPECIES: hypothetical protein [Bacillaceae]
MDKKQKGQVQGKNYSIDVDRMISEGMAGGVVKTDHDFPQIEGARELDKEEKPGEN